MLLHHSQVNPLLNYNDSNHQTAAVTLCSWVAPAEPTGAYYAHMLMQLQDLTHKKVLFEVPDTVMSKTASHFITGKCIARTVRTSSQGMASKPFELMIFNKSAFINQFMKQELCQHYTSESKSRCANSKVSRVTRMVSKCCSSQSNCVGDVDLPPQLL